MAQQSISHVVDLLVLGHLIPLNPLWRGESALHVMGDWYGFEDSVCCQHRLLLLVGLGCCDWVPSAMWLQATSACELKVLLYVCVSGYHTMDWHTISWKMHGCALDSGALAEMSWKVSTCICPCACGEIEGRTSLGLLWVGGRGGWPKTAGVMTCCQGCCV